MPDQPPRWLDASAAAHYLSLTESGFRRRVTSGSIPAPSYALGEATPRWDRDRLDGIMATGTDSTHAGEAFRGLADEIERSAMRGRRRGAGRSKR